MILHDRATRESVNAPSDAAWELFVRTQESAGQDEHDSSAHQAGPRTAVTQPAHARLAGEIAAALSPDLFGELPPKVLDVIAQHDQGWAPADLAALESGSSTTVRSFVALAPEEAVPSWRACVRLAEQQSPLAHILVSRHFCLLADDGIALHQQFRRDEQERRQAAELSPPCSPEDLDRFTHALGFCDLLSLYLCCGLGVATTIPLAHPADPSSSQAEHVTLSPSATGWRFSRPVLTRTVDLHTHGWSGAGSTLQRVALRWTLT